VSVILKPHAVGFSTSEYSAARRLRCRAALRGHESDPTSASEEILLGNIHVAVAGGMENMDLAPYLVARGRWGYRMGDGQLYDSVLRDGLNDAFSDAASGWHTEDSGEDIPKKPRRSPAVTMSLKGAAPAPKRSWRSSDAATAVGDQALASNWGKQHATLEPLKARTMNLIARPNFAPSRRSLLTAGMTIGTTLALHNAAFAEVTIRRGPMLPIKETDIATNGIHLHVTELGEGPAILFVHGFPDTAYTWRKQMQALAAAGFRAIAPDLRGYGGSSAPADLQRCIHRFRRSAILSVCLMPSRYRRPSSWVMTGGRTWLGTPQ
jgi:hypothetical protein